MTLCNMAIEAGARSGLVAVDDTTINYIQGRKFAPKGADWDKAVVYWRTLVSDDGAEFDKTYRFRAEDIEPQVTWGTSPEMVLGVDGKVPNPADEADAVKRAGMERALEYMGLAAGTPLNEIPVDVVFIGLDKIFTDAGFEWREPGCSMCLAMNADRLAPQERCASTSNRNFEGRQGNGGRTHLVSPAMAAAAAVAGHFVDVRQLA